MDMLLLGLGLGAGLTGFVVAVVAFARAGGIGRAFWGLGVAGRASADPAFAAEVDRLMGAAAPPPKPAGPVKPSGEPLRVLALLQAEARLVDFLMEDISGAGGRPDRAGGQGDPPEGPGRPQAARHDRPRAPRQ